MDTDLYQQLLNAAFRFVSLRPRSAKEFHDFFLKKTRQRDDAAGTIQAVEERFAELGYIDDQKFALWWITARNNVNPKGKRALQAELRSKGVEDQVIESVLSGAASSGQNEGEASGINEYELAQKAVGKRLSRWQHLPREAQKKKLYDFLARRGFPPSVIYGVIDECIQKDYNT
jgi:regulatory protein